MIIVVVGFGILVMFFMIVVEKIWDIGIFKLFGVLSCGVMSIFFGYGVLLGMVGLSVGIILGLLFVVYINDIVRCVEWFLGWEVFDLMVYYFSEILMIVDFFMVGWVVVGVVLIVVMVSVFLVLCVVWFYLVEVFCYE